MRPEARRASNFTGEQRLLIFDAWRRSELTASDFAPLVGVTREAVKRAILLLKDAHPDWARTGCTGENEVRAETPLVPSTDTPPPAPPGSAEARRRQSWARMLRMVLEVDPLICKPCGEEMEIVAWITEVDVVDRISSHRREKGLVSPFDARSTSAGGNSARKLRSAVSRSTSLRRPFETSASSRCRSPRRTCSRMRT